jgi:hypothetical protein
MPNWGQKLRPIELAQVVAYVGTLRHTNVPGRPPQGNKVAVEATAPTAPAAAEFHTSVDPRGATGRAAAEGH